MTHTKRNLLRDTLCARLRMEDRPDVLRACADALAIDLPSLWERHELKDDAHPHSETPGRPWPAVYDNEGPQLAALGKGEGR